MDEPGPNHSRGPQSQYEMRNSRVVERDIVAEEIAEQAQASGFASVEVAVYCGLPHFVKIESFQGAISEDSTLPNRLTAAFLENRRLLRLRKPGSATVDSRTRSALSAGLQVSCADGVIAARIENTGSALWLQSPGEVGQVNLGAHLRRKGQLVDFDFDFLHVPLRDDKAPIPTGATVTLTGSLPAMPPGRYEVELDLVAEGVTWFAAIGNTTVTVSI